MGISLQYFVLFMTKADTNRYKWSSGIHNNGSLSRLEVVSAVVSAIETNNLFELVFGNAHKKYHIHNYKIGGLTPMKVIEGYRYLHDKLYKMKGAQEPARYWYDNELRIYIWLLIGYSYLTKISIGNMTYSQWSLFSTIFNHKTVEILQFQAQLLLRNKTMPKKWSNNQQELLKQIIHLKPISETPKWKQIAQQLYQKSMKKFMRTPKQCREHWLNYLDPKKLKTPWSQKQDFTILLYVYDNGKKWAQAVKQLGGTRTEHMVKNRYNSLIKGYCKKIKAKKTPIETTIIVQLLKQLQKQQKNKNPQQHQSQQQQYQQSLPQLPLDKNQSLNLHQNQQQQQQKSRQIEKCQVNNYHEKHSVDDENMDDENMEDEIQKVFLQWSRNNSAENNNSGLSLFFNTNEKHALPQNHQFGSFLISDMYHDPFH